MYKRFTDSELNSDTSNDLKFDKITTEKLFNVHIKKILISSKTILRVRVTRGMVLNATFNNISFISWRSVLWWRKPEYP